MKCPPTPPPYTATAPFNYWFSCSPNPNTVLTAQYNRSISLQFFCVSYYLPVSYIYLEILMFQAAGYILQSQMWFPSVTISQYYPVKYIQPDTFFTILPPLFLPCVFFSKLLWQFFSGSGKKIVKTTKKNHPLIMIVHRVHNIFNIETCPNDCRHRQYTNSSFTYQNN